MVCYEVYPNIGAINRPYRWGSLFDSSESTISRNDSSKSGCICLWSRCAHLSGSCEVLVCSNDLVAIYILVMKWDNEAHTCYPDKTRWFCCLVEVVDMSPTSFKCTWSGRGCCGGGWLMYDVTCSIEVGTSMDLGMSRFYRILTLDFLMDDRMGLVGSCLYTSS